MAGEEKRGERRERACEYMDTISRHMEGKGPGVGCVCRYEVA